jgi:hypothetical protein
LPISSAHPRDQLHRFLGLLHIDPLASAATTRLPGEPAGTVKNRALVLAATIRGPSDSSQRRTQ